MVNKETRIETRKKKRLKKKVYIIVPLLIILFSVLAYGLYFIKKADSALTDSYVEDGRDKSALRDQMVDPKYDHVSVLIMGIDENEKRAEEGGPYRTDALILATLNKDDKSVKLVSIPRDSYVYIPKVGYSTKINHAHAYGGPEATIEVVENLLEVPVDYYVTLNFHAFVDVIDAVNGIEVDVPYEIIESNSQDKGNSIHIEPGLQTLNGEEALAFSRTRKKDSDVERGKRQLEVIQAVIDKTTSVSSFFQLDDVIVAVGNNMKTNMTFAEMTSFIAYGMNGKNIDVESFSLEGEDYQPTTTYYWKLDELFLDETKAKLKEHLDLSDQSNLTIQGGEDKID